MKFNIFLLLFAFVGAFADTTPLPRAVPGFIKRSYVNNIRSALVGTIVPRNSIGNAGDTAGNLGNGTYRWKLFRGQSVVFINDPGEAPITVRPAASGQTVDLTIQTLTTLPLGASILTITPAGHLGYGAPEAGNFAVSALASGAFSTNNTFCDVVGGGGNCTVFSTPIDGAPITNLSVTLNTFGHPVKVSLISGVSAYASLGGHFAGAVTMDSAGVGGILFETNGVPLGNPILGAFNRSTDWVLPCSHFSHIYTNLPAGNYTFTANAAKALAGDPTLYVTGCKLEAHEIF